MLPVKKKKKILTFNNGETIIQRGSKEGRMYIILEGEVEVTINDDMHMVTLATFKKNDFFGEISLINRTPRTADVVAKGKTKVTYISSMKQLDRLLIKNPIFARRMVQKLT